MLTVIDIALRISISGLKLARFTEKRANKARKSIERHTERKVYKRYGKVAGVSSFAVNRTIDFYYGQARIIGHAAAIGAKNLAEITLKIIQKVISILRDVLLSMSVYFIVIDFCIFFILMASSAGFLSLYCTEDDKGNIVFDEKVMAQLETTPTKISSSKKESSTSSGGNIICKKWNFSDDQLWAITRLCDAEQGGDGYKGVATQASIIGNQLERRGHNTPDACMKYLSIPGGTGTFPWDGFYAVNSISAMNGSGGNENYFKIVKAVLNEGKRTLPAYIDEHDLCPDDIEYAKNSSKEITSSSELNSTLASGSPISAGDHSQYKMHKTAIKNIYGSTYIFYIFPTDSSTCDPFGYTSPEKRKEMGDNHYDMDTLLKELGLK